MLLRSFGLALLALFAFVACGPSSAQIKTARTARYQVTAAEAFQAGVAALDAGDFKIQVADPIASQAVTVPRWYEADGTFTAKDADGKPLLTDGAINLTVELTVVAEGEAVRVNVVPVVLQARTGYTQGVRIEPDSPNMPGWVTGKIDNVYLSIHGRLKTKVIAGS